MRRARERTQHERERRERERREEADGRRIVKSSCVEGRTGKRREEKRQEGEQGRREEEKERRQNPKAFDMIESLFFLVARA